MRQLANNENSYFTLGISSQAYLALLQQTKQFSLSTQITPVIVIIAKSHTELYLELVSYKRTSENELKT